MAIALNHSQAQGLARIVLVGIANHDGDGGAWPSVAKLARYAGRSPRAVQRYLRELELLGEVVVHEQAGGDATTRPDQRPNLYEFTLACPPDCDGSKQHRLPGDPGYGVTRMTPRGRQRGDARVANGVTHLSPEPSLEPSTPQPPQAGEPASCSRHRSAPGACCRACGTTPRQLEAAARAAAAAARRAADAAALRDQRASRPPSDVAAAGAAAARARLARPSDTTLEPSC
jgi:hypothetical protein